MKEVKFFSSTDKPRDIFLAFEQNGIVIVDVGRSFEGRANYSRLFSVIKNSVYGPEDIGTLLSRTVKISEKEDIFYLIDKKALQATPGLEKSIEDWVQQWLAQGKLSDFSIRVD